MTELVNVVPLVLLAGVPVLLTYRTFLVYKKQQTLIRDLDAARIQGRQWRDETRALLKGLGEAIDRQSCSPLGVLPRRPSCASGRLKHVTLVSGQPTRQAPLI